MQAELLASPKPGEPTIVLTGASLSWEAGRLRKTALHDISLQVRLIWWGASWARSSDQPPLRWRPQTLSYQAASGCSYGVA